MGQFAVESDIKQIQENQKTIIENQNSIMKNQERIFKELGSQRAMIDVLIHKEEKELSKLPSKNMVEKEQWFIEEILPINCLEDLDKLELELMKEENVNKLVCLVKLCDISIYLINFYFRSRQNPKFVEHQEK